MEECKECKECKDTFYNGMFIAKGIICNIKKNSDEKFFNYIKHNIKGYVSNSTILKVLNQSREDYKDIFILKDMIFKQDLEFFYQKAYEELTNKDTGFYIEVD